MLKSKDCKVILSLLPFLLLVFYGFNTLVAQTEYYRSIYPVLSQLTGFSILSNLVWLFYARVHRLCFYSIVSILTLISLNIFNIIYSQFLFDYYYLYVKILIFSGIIMSTYFLIKNK